ncbi:hypothetical protein PSAB_07575 [Paenibacillus sabinae T27]|uniref:Uncharacterized protein n=1 Tax=Paenibacillus sabinae T27 TaxID=1268072 RepID=X4ZGB6_9BACL|nr:hypothetical protein PSAB_07575 [Paenibacillus sabinae T27]
MCRIYELPGKVPAAFFMCNNCGFLCWVNRTQSFTVLSDPAPEFSAVFPKKILCPAGLRCLIIDIKSTLNVKARETA